jgi:integrase
MWDAIDLENGTLEVKRTLARIKGAMVLQEQPKTDASRRTVQLPRQVVELLREHQEQQLKDGRGCSTPGFEGLVFTSRSSHPLSPEGCYQTWKYIICKKAGVVPMTVHDIRHLSITKMVQETSADPATVSRKAGHTDVRFTMGVYTHQNAAIERQGTQELADLFDALEG